MGVEKLNILFVGNLKGTSTSLFYYQRLIEMGHQVYPFEPNYYQSMALVDKLSLKIKKRPRQSSIDDINQSLLKIAQRNPFDVVFVFNENFFDTVFLELLRKKSKKSMVMIYHSHDNLFAKGVNAPAEFLQALPLFDYVFTTKSQNVEPYKKLGQANSFFLPAAFEPLVHRPIPIDESRFEGKSVGVSFVGTFDQSRLPVLQTIGFDKVHIWGENWKQFRDYWKFKKNIHPRGIYYLEYADVLSHSLISLGLLRIEAQDLHTQRTFEIPACRSLQVAPHNSELLTFFTEDQEIVLFSSLEELKDKVAFYSRENAAREKIVQQAFDKVYRHQHTYYHRIQTIFETARLSSSRISIRKVPKAA